MRSATQRAALAAAAAFALVLAGCAERRSPVDTKTHPPEWNDAASPDFHGTRVAKSGASSCTACHGAGLEGAPEVPSCDDCHAGAGGHPAGWSTPAHAAFHGRAVEREGPGPCRECHGPDYEGGWSGVSCYDCHAGGASGHPDGWMTPGSASFHGVQLLIQGVQSCTPCHGAGLGGGTSGSACGECHGLPEAGG
jgi:hypothetical protein